MPRKGRYTPFKLVSTYGLPFECLLIEAKRQNGILDIPGFYEEARKSGWPLIRVAKMIGSAIKDEDGEEVACKVLSLLLSLEKKNNWPIHKTDKPNIFDGE